MASGGPALGEYDMHSIYTVRHVAPSVGECRRSAPCCMLVVQRVVQQHHMAHNIPCDLPYGTICRNPSVPYVFPEPGHPVPYQIL